MHKRYTSANLTARDWCKRRPGQRPKAAPKPAVTEPELNLEEVAKTEAQVAEAAREQRRLVRESTRNQTA